jgi:hypothetical protein
MLLSLNSCLIGLVKKTNSYINTSATLILFYLFYYCDHLGSFLSVHSMQLVSSQHIIATCLPSIYFFVCQSLFFLLHIVHSMWRITVEFILVPSSLSFAYEKNHIQFSFFFLWSVHVPSYINLFLPFFRL